MQFRYQLGSVGWATATIEVDGRSISIIASYLHDSLRDLAEAIIDLRKPNTEALVTFMDEPGEHHLVLRRLNDQVMIEVRWTNSWTSGKPARLGDFKTLFEATVLFADLQKAVVGAMTEVVSTWGLEGYKEKWVQHNFPAAEYEQLRAS